MKKKLKLNVKKKLKIKIETWINNYKKVVNRMTPLKLGNSVLSHWNLDLINPQDLNPKSFRNVFNEYNILFIKKFISNINNNYYTVDSKTNKVTCRLGARRSIRDIYLIVKYYFPEVTFEQVLKDIVELYNEGIINGSYCNDVRLYVFYTDQISYSRNAERNLEDSLEIKFKDLINYFNNNK